MIRILALLVEDDASVARALRERFRKDNIDVILSGTLREAVAILRAASRKGTVDIVILDLALPDSSGKATFYALNRQFPKVPIIVVTGTVSDAERIDLARNGAIDCIEKGAGFDADRLCNRIIETVERQRQLDSDPPPSPRGKAPSYIELRELIQQELDSKLQPYSKRLAGFEQTDRYMKAAKVIGAIVAAAVAATLALLANQ